MKIFHYINDAPPGARAAPEPAVTESPSGSVGGTNEFVCAGFAIFLGGRLLTANVGESAPVLVLTSICSVGASIATTLASFPPRAYLRRVDRG